MPPYRRRYRRYNYRRRRRYYRRRFGTGGGDRKPPSSYAEAYGYLKYFFEVYAAFVSSIAAKGANPVVLYAQPEVLSMISRLVIQDDLEEKDIEYMYSAQTSALAASGSASIASDIHKLFISCYLLPMRKHVKNFNELIEQVPKKEYKIGEGENAPTFSSFASSKLFVDQTDSQTALLIALKSRVKSLIQALTKRKLPFSLALSEWCCSYLKAKRRHNKSVYFWRIRTVPRYMILLTMSINALWRSARYADTLVKYLKEINYVKNPMSAYKLKKSLESGDEKVRAAATLEQSLYAQKDLKIAPLDIKSEFAKEINY